MSQGKKISQETKEKMIAEYLKGTSSEDVGKMFNSKAQTVTKIVLAAGFEIRGANKKLTEEDKTNIINKYQNEKTSCAKLAKQFNVTAMTVYNLLKSNNVQTKKE